MSSRNFRQAARIDLSGAIKSLLSLRLPNSVVRNFRISKPDCMHSSGISHAKSLYSTLRSSRNLITLRATSTSGAGGVQDTPNTGQLIPLRRFITSVKFIVARIHLSSDTTGRRNETHVSVSMVSTLALPRPQHPQQKEQHDAAKEDERHAHAGLAVYLGNQVGCGDI